MALTRHHGIVCKVLKKLSIFYKKKQLLWDMENSTWNIAHVEWTEDTVVRTLGGVGSEGEMLVVKDHKCSKISEEISMSLNKSQCSSSVLQECPPWSLVTSSSTTWNKSFGYELLYVEHFPGCDYTTPPCLPSTIAKGSSLVFFIQRVPAHFILAWQRAAKLVNYRLTGGCK